jgi:hypothetical protein
MPDPDDKTLTADDLTGGFAGSHPEADIQPVLVAPTLAVALNTVRAFLIPVGCWRIDDVRFDFDSSFVRSPSRKEMALLARLVKEHPGSPLTIFGHDDPTGDDAYNKTLSGRRARAIYAMLIRDTAAWEDLYSHSFGGDKWGARSIQNMLFFVGEEADNTGVMDGATTKALKSFQEKNGLPNNGANNAATRAALFQAYMDKVCVNEDGAPFKLGKGDFLARGADPDGKGDFQGCGRFNPVLMFSAAENKTFQSPGKHNQRNSENAPNRRVMALLFRPGTVVDPGRWPCPAAKDGIEGCQKRFWSDAPKRREFQANRRTFEADQDTYACRFYQRLFQLSPCATSAGPEVISVLEVKAQVQGTKSLRDPAKRRPVAILRSSNSTHESLADNKPAILVRGCNDVELEATTTPVAPVTWTVAPNENSGAAPAITPIGGGRKAILKTDKGGSFSVTASTGASKVVWNVVFVSVNVDASSAVIITRDDQYADSGSTLETVKFRSGEDKKGKHSFDMTVNKVELVGGGLNGDIGIKAVALQYLQNGTKDTLRGNYAGGGTVTERPGGTLPIVDANGDATLDPTADQSMTVTPDNDTAAVRQIQVTDPPAGSFPRRHPNTKQPLLTVSGVNDFTAAIAATSNDAPDAFVVQAKINWTADYSGDVDQTKPKGKYTPNGAKTTADAALTLVSPATGGQDAFDAGLELFEPRFNANLFFDAKP